MTHRSPLAARTASSASMARYVSAADTPARSMRLHLIGGAGKGVLDGGANNDTATDYSATEGDTKISVP